MYIVNRQTVYIDSCTPTVDLSTTDLSIPPVK